MKLRTAIMVDNDAGGVSGILLRGKADTFWMARIILLVLLFCHVHPAHLIICSCVRAPKRPTTNLPT